MANATTAFGFRPVKEPDPSSILTFVAISGTANLFVGDAVIPGGTGSATYGYADVVRAAAGDTNVIGVVVGFEPLSPDSLTSKYGATGAVRLVKVVPALPSTEFEVQANASMAITDLGNRYDLVATGGDTTDGFSRMALDVSSAGTTGKTLWAHRFINRPDNEFPGVTGIKVGVYFLESIWLNGPGV